MDFVRTLPLATQCGGVLVLLSTATVIFYSGHSIYHLLEFHLVYTDKEDEEDDIVEEEPTELADYAEHEKNDETHSLPTMSGYLRKSVKNKDATVRFFETSGVYLLYYQSRNMTKLLAALALPTVGEIELVDDQPTRFTVLCGDTTLTLEAETAALAKQWVSVLSKLRDARVGNHESMLR